MSARIQDEHPLVILFYALGKMTCIIMRRSLGSPLPAELEEKLQEMEKSLADYEQGLN
jgi:hypothetical protein